MNIPKLRSEEVTPTFTFFDSKYSPSPSGAGKGGGRSWRRGGKVVGWLLFCLSGSTTNKTVASLFST